MKLTHFLWFRSNVLVLSVFTCGFINTTSLTVKADTVPPLKISNQERLLIISPHPDDETLGAGGLAQQVLEQGGSVRSVVVTSGDAYVGALMVDSGKAEDELGPTDYIQLGYKRHNESKLAAHVLGQDRIHLNLLGFPDGSVYPMLVSNWSEFNPFFSWFTRVKNVPYDDAFEKGVAHSGELLVKKLVAILNETNPTIIAFPDVMEDDSDHSAVGMFSLYAIRNWKVTSFKKSLPPRVLTYIIHWQHLLPPFVWPPFSTEPKPVDVSAYPLYQPSDLPLRGNTRTCLELSTTERNLKAEALRQYVTQQNVMGAYLMAFVNSTECFTELNPNHEENILNVKEFKNIKNTVFHWQGENKRFSPNPLNRKDI